MRDTAKLTQLRATLANAGLEPPEKHARVALGCTSLDLALNGELARGALHEIFVSPGDETAGTGFTVALAQRLNARKHLLWIRQDFSALEHGELSATGLLELGLDPSRVLVLHVTDAVSALRAAGDALTCAALGAILIETTGEAKILNLVTSRRLTLASAQDGVTAFTFAFRREAASERGGNALACPVSALADNKRKLGQSRLRNRARAQPARDDRALGGGVEL